jgi:hypothetical protein
MMKKVFLFSFIFAIGVSLVACQPPADETIPQVTVTSETTVTLTPNPTVSQTSEPTFTLQSTQTPVPEQREFIFPGNIEFQNKLTGYNLELNSGVDKVAINKDIIQAQLGSATSPSIPENRKIAEEVWKEHPEYEGIGSGSPYEDKVKFMLLFLEKSGGIMTIKDHNFTAYSVDFNLPIGFRVELVDTLSSTTANFLALSAGNPYGRGGGGIMYSGENGQLLYKVEIVSGTLNAATSDRRYIYKAWDWSVGGIISDLFRQTISQTAYKDRDSNLHKYQLYTKGGVPKSGNFYSDVYWTFIK